LDFKLYSALEDTPVYVQVRQDAQGWSYVALAMPLDGLTADAEVSAIARNAGGRTTTPSSIPTTLKGGGSACSFWSGWASMDGGRIEGEESISASSSSGGGSPCGKTRVVNHGKK